MSGDAILATASVTIRLASGLKSATRYPHACHPIVHIEGTAATATVLKAWLLLTAHWMLTEATKRLKNLAGLRGVGGVARNVCGRVKADLRRQHGVKALGQAWEVMFGVPLNKPRGYSTAWSVRTRETRVVAWCLQAGGVQTGVGV